MYRVRLIIPILLILVSIVFAQTNVANPDLLTFNSPDWDKADRHELEIIRTSDNVVVQTLVDNGPYTSQAISVGINVMPVAFGEYVFRATACSASPCNGLQSEPSNLWDRVPGKPSQPVAQ